MLIFSVSFQFYRTAQVFSRFLDDLVASICGRVVKAPDSSSGQLCWREFEPHRMYLLTANFFFDAKKAGFNTTLFPGGPPPQY
jgi:hypothetical protein